MTGNSVRILALGLVSICWMSLEQRAFAADPKLVAAAEQEGQLVLYNCDISESPVQVKRFSELYPKIKVTTYVASCWQTYNRHVAERGASRPIADAFISTDDVFMKMDDEGLARRLRVAGAHTLPERYATAKCQLYPLQGTARGLHGQHRSDEGPAGPAGLDRFCQRPAQWKDKISFYDPRTSSLAFTVLATLHQTLGAEGARKIYAGLKSMNAELSSSTPAGTTKLLSGEKPIMFYILTNQYGATVAKGAPLVFNVPKSGAIGTHFGVAT